MSDNSFAGLTFGNNPREIDEMREKYICQKWNDPIKMTLDKDCEVTVYADSIRRKNIKVKGNLLGNLKGARNIMVKYWAAAPPTWGLGLDGSGLPFANEQMAFDHTVNRGVIQPKGLEFSFELIYPNSYYTNMGIKKVLPEVNIRFVSATGEALSKVHTIPIGPDVPYRSLTIPRQRDWNEGPLWYTPHVPIVDQSTLLVENKYPQDGQEYPHFWGTRYTV